MLLQIRGESALTQTVATVKIPAADPDVILCPTLQAAASNTFTRVDSGTITPTRSHKQAFPLKSTRIKQQQVKKAQHHKNATQKIKDVKNRQEVPEWEDDVCPLRTPVIVTLQLCPV